MVKRMSRARRASAQADEWRMVAEALRQIVLDNEGGEDDGDESKAIAEKAVKQANEALGTFDASELEALTEEITTWRDNMSGANMEHLPKYDEVSEAADTLEQIETDAPTIREFSDIDEAADDIESRADELENVSFPGMFG